MNPSPVPPAAGALDARDLAVRFARARAVPALNGEPGEERRLAAIYERCWRLGRSAARRFGPVDDRSRLAELLGASGHPCFAGRWRIDGDRATLSRPGCTAGPGNGECDRMREAADGLVAGLSSRTRFVRRASLGRGGAAGAACAACAACEDRLVDGDDRQGVFGEPAPDVAARLAGPLARLAERGGGYDLIGQLENRIYIARSGGDSSGCSGAGLYFDLLADHLEREFPGLELVDATPRAVVP
jgi:hypothetical protein